MPGSPGTTNSDHIRGAGATAKRQCKPSLTPSHSPGRNRWPPDVGQTQPFRHQTGQLSDQVSASTLYPMQQPVGARQAAINLKLLLQYALRIDRTKRHYPIPLQLGASDNPFLEPRACHGVHQWLSARARPVTQSLNAFLFIAVMPLVSR